MDAIKNYCESMESGEQKKNSKKVVCFSHTTDEMQSLLSACNDFTYCTFSERECEIIGKANKEYVLCI